MSTYVEITNGIGESEFGAVEMTPEGDAIVKTGSFSHGQGHETTFAQIAAGQMGLPVERVTVIKGDTDRVARGTGTYGSKSTQIGGAAARQAADELVEKAKELAAEQLEADPRDMVLELGAGTFHVAGAPQPSLDWSELAGRLHAAGRLPELSVETDFKAKQPTFPFGAHVVVVEIDSETGSVALRRVIAVDDAGTIINPMIADGQIHGGVAAGLAQALYEEFVYDADGNPQNANFVTYCIPGPHRVPVVRARPDRDADAGQPARRQGDRRVGDDRLDARGAERGDRRAVAPGRALDRDARQRRAGVAGDPGRPRATRAAEPVTEPSREILPRADGVRAFAGPAFAGIADCAPSGRVRLDALARWLQDIAYLDVLDAGLESVAVWVVRRTRIRVNRWPRFAERFELTTFCSGLGRMWAERRTDVRRPGDRRARRRGGLAVGPPGP